MLVLGPPVPRVPATSGQGSGLQAAPAASRGQPEASRPFLSDTRLRGAVESHGDGVTSQRAPSPPSLPFPAFPSGELTVLF